MPLEPLKVRLPPELDDILELAKAHNIVDWDYILVGDGSGSSWDRGFGWATVVADSEDTERRIFAGAAITGSNNVAELMAYVHPLTYILNKESTAIGGTSPRAVKVHVFTDSQYVVKTCEKPARTITPHFFLVFLLEMMSRQGLLVEWHHIPRATTMSNKVADHVGRVCRQALEALDFGELSSQAAKTPREEPA